MNASSENREEFAALASYLAQRRDAILHAWRQLVDCDPELATASTISRVQFNDHIPEVLDAFERELCGIDPDASIRAAEQQGAAEHGLHRWQQGYDQREAMLEWGHLHLCVLDAIESYGSLHPEVAMKVMPPARRALVRLCNGGVCESAARFAWLQRTEAAGRVRELEQALAQLQTFERERAEIWREAAHDLRGSVSAISSAAAIVGREGVKESTRSQFSHSLQKSVVSLHDLLSDLMSLARLEAGHDRRNVTPFDAALLMREFCEVMRPLAAERNLFLQCAGPESLAVEGDPAKVRRIAQNLVLNALRVTERGGVRVTWQRDGAATRIEQWVLCIQDTGPGFTNDSGPLLARALKVATDEAHEVEERAESEGYPSAQSAPPATLPSQTPPLARGDLQGEGIGLSIVKRLCEVLDASLELESAPGKGTTFRVVVPSVYVK